MVDLLPTACICLDTQDNASEKMLATTAFVAVENENREERP